LAQEVSKVKIADIFRYLPKGTHSFLVSNLKNIHYLTGFSGDWAFLVLSKKGMKLYTDSRFTEQAEKETRDCRIITITKPFATYLKSAAGKGKTIAFESSDLRYAQYRTLHKLLQHRKLVPTTGIIERFRMIKTKGEIEKIRKAAGIADTAFRKICGFIKTGRSELEVAAELENILRKHGSAGHPFPTIAITSVNTSLPHGQPGTRKIKKGDLFLIDFGATYQGYCSDITRTVVMGKPNRKQEQIYRIVLRAQRAAIASINVGKPLKDVDKTARDIIAEAGYGKNFGHGLGHGIGLDVHEAPGVSFRSKEKVTEGMVFTVEPGIYLPRWGGVRIEDDVAILKGKVTVLTKSPKLELKIIS
jgi:Xaa-Pro aminopeptidase